METLSPTIKKYKSVHTSVVMLSSANLAARVGARSFMSSAARSGAAKQVRRNKMRHDDIN